MLADLNLKLPDPFHQGPTPEVAAAEASRRQRIHGAFAGELGDITPAKAILLDTITTLFVELDRIGEASAGGHPVNPGDLTALSNAADRMLGRISKPLTTSTSEKD